jgi:DNA-binding transcriptional MerR regulator
MTDDVRFPWEEPDDGAAQAARPQIDASARRPADGVEAAPHGALELEPAPVAERQNAHAPEPEDAAGAEEDDGAAAAGTRERPIAAREYYSISEVCDLVDLKPHVLRYWETQFPVLNPSKNRSGNRVYQRKEIKLIQLVKHLLYDEKYTVEGAKQRLERMRRGGELPAATTTALDGQTIALLRSELRRLSELLAPPDHA